jgi:ribulose 1,5-bisphosphate synthetase/thiazole synthase
MKQRKSMKNKNLINVTTDVLVYGATAGGVAAAVAAARMGRNVTLVERGEHIGGVATAGLHMIDILRKNATGGICSEHVRDVQQYYINTYGADSEQYRLTFGGYWAEPHVASQLVQKMLDDEEGITLLKSHVLKHVLKKGQRVTGCVFEERGMGRLLHIDAQVTIDATYEADVAAAAGVKYRVGRESRTEYNERFAGKVYYDWRYNQQRFLPESTGEASPFIQAACFRLTLTTETSQRRMFEKPDTYEDFLPLYKGLLDDFESGRARRLHEVIYFTAHPNGKHTGNGHIEAVTSLNLAEYIRDWPDGDWDTRDRLYQLYRDYTEGLWWFLQNDSGVPWLVREEALCYGLASDEYPDNDNFPPQLYIREARRIIGQHIFTEHDAVPVGDRVRPHIHKDTIAVCDHNFDCHPCRNRGGDGTARASDGFELVEGVMWFRNKLNSYNRVTTVPYRCMVPESIDGLLVPVGLSASHVGFTALRMEPLWMATGQAAGVAAVQAITDSTTPAKIDTNKLQNMLLDQGQTLVYFDGLEPDDPSFKEIQRAAIDRDCPTYNIEGVTKG